MNRLRIASAAACSVFACFLILACTDFSFTIEFVTPDKAESTETFAVDLPADTLVQINNDIGSTRISIDPSATQATIEVVRTALAGTQEEADDLLGQMIVTVIDPTPGNNVLIVDAQRPPEATDDESQFQATFTEDEITINAIVGSALVAEYKLRITLPPGHSVEASQDVGRIRAVALDEPSTLTTSAGTIRCIAASAAITAQTEAGSIEIESHQGSLDLDTKAGTLEIEIVSLAADEQVIGRTQAGGIQLFLPSEINAQLSALTELGHIRFRKQDFSSTSDVFETFDSLDATLGSGGATIDIQTEVGQIRIESF